MLWRLVTHRNNFTLPCAFIILHSETRTFLFPDTDGETELHIGFSYYRTIRYVQEALKQPGNKFVTHDHIFNCVKSLHCGVSSHRQPSLTRGRDILYEYDIIILYIYTWCSLYGDQNLDIPFHLSLFTSFSSSLSSLPLPFIILFILDFILLSSPC
jgi:hypothetical protein